MTETEKTLSVLIKDKARDLGFDLCGIAPSQILKEHEAIIKSWCSDGMNGDMSYLCRDTGKRINPDYLFPGVKSVIVTGLNYFNGTRQGGDGIPVISRYAYGVNYHNVIKFRLDKLLGHIKIISRGVKGKIFVDSAPILEKAWAGKAGLGWPGKHSILINKEIGSYFFLGIILTNADVDYDDPYTDDHCGSCRSCIESCPTGAINENRTLDVRKCIAYLTIESKTAVPEELASKMGGRLFGCDRCQEVCPWNRNATPNRNSEFEPQDELLQMTAEDWLTLSQERFKRLFIKSSVASKKYDTFMKNVAIIIKSG